MNRTWHYAEAVGSESAADTFLRQACLNFTRDNPTRVLVAHDLLTAHPDLPEQGIAVAAVCGRADLVRQFIGAKPGTATEPTGPYGWSPLMYLTYGRIAVAEASTLAAARTLLAAGADPNDGRLFAGLTPPFTVITGVFGGGEQDQSAHPHAFALGRLLLEAGAEPNDGQTVYNRMFDDDDESFRLLFEFGLGRGDVGPWRKLPAGLSPSPPELLTQLLDWAVNHDQRARVGLLASHGADLIGPLPTGKTPLETAVVGGNLDLAEQLVVAGALAITLDPVETFISAALSGDRVAVDATSDAVVTAAKLARPSLVVWAAGQDRVDGVQLLVGRGFAIDALGRSDVPEEQPWQTALHAAVERNSAAMVSLLLDLGADPEIRDARFDGTPLDWAGHLGRPELAALLSRRPAP